MSSPKSADSIEGLFVEAVGILDEPCPSTKDTYASLIAGKAAGILDELCPSTRNTYTSPITSKTPTTNIHISELVTAVDGAKGSKYVDGTPSQGLLVIPPCLNANGSRSRLTEKQRNAHI